MAALDAAHLPAGDSQTVGCRLTQNRLPKSSETSEVWRIGQIEPLGVHPAHRQRGLGLALLCESVRRLHAHGAARVYVETDNYRNAALATYEAAGFRVEREVWVYRWALSAAVPVNGPGTD